MVERTPLSRRKVLSALALGAAAVGTAAASPASAGMSRASGGRAATSRDATTYTLTIVNNSAIDDENALVFQQPPPYPEGIQSLAWLSKMCHAGTDVTFTWEIDYNFVWGQTGTLIPGVNYDAGQVIPADFEGQSMVTLSYVDGGFKFGTPGPGAPAGCLVIEEDASVPGSGSPDQGCVGVGMSGAGTFVVPTQAVSSATFVITPNYWVAFGKYVAGSVVSAEVLTCPYQIKFPDGQTTATAKFDGLSWTVEYGG